MDKQYKKLFSFRLLDADSKKQLQKTFENIEQNLGIDGLGHVLYAAVMELVANAVRANMKRIFLTTNCYDLSRMESYKEGLRQFKKHMQVFTPDEYAKAFEELDFRIILDVDLDHNRLLIYVENNTVLLEEEEKRIRRNLARAMGIHDLAEFSMHYGDETETVGGLGLALVVTLIREIGFNPAHFRVYCKDKKTVARLEFPLSANYVPIRDRWTEPVGG